MNMNADMHYHTHPSFSHSSASNMGLKEGIFGVVTVALISRIAAQEGNLSDCKKTEKGLEYGGYISKTKGGLTCRHWKDKDWPDMYFPNDGYSAAKAKNYCRNPNGVLAKPWCYIDDDDIYQYCNVPLCDDGPVRPTQSPPSGCADTDGDCAQFKGLGYCDSKSPYYPFMKDNCKKTCGLCVTVTTTLKPPKPTLPPAGCVDKDDSCSGFKNQGYCERDSQYYPFMSKNCQKTCGFCATDCKDNHDFCESWAAAGECKTNPGFMNGTCKKSCNLC